VVLMGGETLTSSQFREALKSGVDTIVPENISMESLIFTLHLVHGGAVVFPKHMVQSVGRLPLSDDLGIAKPETLLGEADNPYGHGIASAPLLEDYRLSERETSVLMWLRDGLPNKEIARKMSIAEATVKVHVKAILRKVKMRNRTQVASWATKNNLGSQVAFAAE
jgi:two-component system nitrate/nitrite response regulator NarL